MPACRATTTTLSAPIPRQRRIAANGAQGSPLSEPSQIEGSDSMRSRAMPCGAVRCRAMPCDAVRCRAVPCGAVRCEQHLSKQCFSLVSSNAGSAFYSTGGCKSVSDEVSAFQAFLHKGCSLPPETEICACINCTSSPCLLVEVTSFPNHWTASPHSVTQICRGTCPRNRGLCPSCSKK